jgi:trehalose 6-phosphate synthase
MNLVAKEYVAAQDPSDPGVLVLSGFAGAAKELEAAVQVNPHDIDDLVQKLTMALNMPHAERTARWNVMIEKLKSGSIQNWFESFLSALTGQTSGKPLAVRTEALAAPALHDRRIAPLQ